MPTLEFEWEKDKPMTGYQVIAEGIGRVTFFDSSLNDGQKLLVASGTGFTYFVKKKETE
jgi:hypothetical protein